MAVEITAVDAKVRFGELLARVAKGEEFVVTRHGEPVALITPRRARSNPTASEIRRAIEEMRSEGSLIDPGESVSTLRRSGRR